MDLVSTRDENKTCVSLSTKEVGIVPGFVSLSEEGLGLALVWLSTRKEGMGFSC